MKVTRAALALLLALGLSAGTTPAQAAPVTTQSSPCIFWFICC